MNFHLYCQPSYSSGVNTGAGVRTEKKSFKTLADIFICFWLVASWSSGKIRAIIKSFISRCGPDPGPWSGPMSSPIPAKVA